MAATVEDPAWIDDHAGRMHFPGHYAPGLNLHATLSENHSIEAAGNDHAVAFDLAFHFGAVAKDHRLLRDDVALDITIDAERAGDRQRSFQGYALIDESRPLFTACAFCHVAVFFAVAHFHGISSSPASLIIVLLLTGEKNKSTRPKYGFVELKTARTDSVL